MPKKKSSRPAASLGSNNNPEPKSPSQIKRERVVRIAAITIVLGLLLSLLAGAFSFTPSQAAEPSAFANSVQILQSDDSPVGTSVDTDGDGIINNEDPDIDGDGVVNANDGDIDGDGKANFDDGDPAETNGYDGKTPHKPGAVTLQDLAENGVLTWLVLTLLVTAVSAVLILRKSQQNRRKKAEKNL